MSAENPQLASLLAVLDVIEERAHPERPEPVEPENPTACPVCLRAWDFVTSGTLSPIPGVVIPRHPVGPCVPPPPVQYEQDEEEKPVRRKSRRNTVPTTKVCEWAPCGKVFSTIYYALTTCSPECGRKKLKAYRAEYYQNREVRKYIRRTKQQAKPVIPRQRTGRRRAA